MTATYGDAQIYASSRVKYDGSADDTVGIGRAPGITASASRPTGAASAPRPVVTVSAPRPR